MRRTPVFELALIIICAPGALHARAQVGLQASLGATSGDLRDTTGGRPCLDLGAHVEWPVAQHGTLRARFDGMFFETAHRTGSGLSDGVAWNRQLDTQVRGWALGAEYLFRDLPWAPRLRFGGGVHATRWQVDSTSTLEVTGSGTTGTVAEANVPGWTKLGWSLAADYQLTGRLRAEARMLTSPFSWEGERVNVLQLGLLWTF
jgi:hypothetical protein